MATTLLYGLPQNVDDELGVRVDQKQIAMKAGDVAHIHRGVPHFFRNTASSPSAALVIFSPPFDGRDFVAEEEKKTSEDDVDEPKKKRRWWPF